MDDDYEASKKLLDELRKKYCNYNENENQDKQSTTLKINNQKVNKKKIIKDKIQPTNENIITLIIDDNLINKYKEIADKLKEIGINYEINNQIFPGLITWEGNLNVKEVILIMNWEEVILKIKSSDLLSYIQSVQDVLPNKNIYLGLFGIIDYFKYWIIQRDTNINKREQKRLIEYKDSLKITREEFEMALTEVQLFCNCCYRLLNTPQDIVDLIQQFTKSILQLPEKLEKREKYKDYEWHMLKDNRDCVPVDKNGNGLQRLWQQQLTTFELARLETAEAIVGKFPTPVDLFASYKNLSEAEGRKLIEDIPIRRAAGPLTSCRKIGPELSGKVYTFFNSLNGDDIL